MRARVLIQALHLAKAELWDDKMVKDKMTDDKWMTKQWMTKQWIGKPSLAQ
ncbi:MAG: hypothetical protein NTX50_27580 [Candidatus Sumerlaeota bacterium]|nr:hypothetical protein [Candidatus Sumerlaeota bacterium]